MRLNSVGRKEVSFLFDRIVARSVRHQYIIKSARSTWNFVRQQATLAQGSASEAHLNMDVNLRRLPDNVMYYPKFPVPLAGFIEHPYPTDSADIQSKQRKDSLHSR